jgi:AcrR family transcriptional regulator
MGNREDLLAGAKACLFEKGYARTTVRDIASTAGVSMAAIGYHFGSREALLNAALFQAMDEWGAELAEALAPETEEASGQYEALWTRLIALFHTHRRFWLASVESFVQAEYYPDLREQVTTAHGEGRRGMAALLLGVAEATLAEETVRTLGAVQSALVAGVMMQWLTDPDNAPTAAEITRGLRALADVTGF